MERLKLYTLMFVITAKITTNKFPLTLRENILAERVSW